MSEYVSLRRVQSITTHPSANNLVVIKVGEFTVCHNKESAKGLKVGDLVIHFPSDICIDPVWAEELGVQQYCRSYEYTPGLKQRCRIVAARLRGVPSYGFIIPNNYIPDSELDTYYGVVKPKEFDSDGQVIEHPDFHRYTKIKRIQLHPDAWKPGINVRVTEKLHGRNTRVGVVKVDGEWEYLVGSHDTIKNSWSDDGLNFWYAATKPVLELLNILCDGVHPVIIYGELIGKGMQDLDYGYAEPTFRVFDIMVGGNYLDWAYVKSNCESMGITTVPVLHEGAFSWCLVDSFTNGGSTLQNPSVYQSSFKGREGVVITPLKETWSPVLNDRLIGKSISVDYEERKGKHTEYH